MASWHGYRAGVADVSRRKQLGWLLVIVGSLLAIFLGTLAGLIFFDALDSGVTPLDLAIGFLLGCLLWVPFWWWVLVRPFNDR